uniref:NADH dehydrogenase subunit 5 n=1 Tax=Brugia timori TaxID=42155 RepID=A0A0R3QGM4_9BILA
LLALITQTAIHFSESSIENNSHFSFLTQTKYLSLFVYFLYASVLSKIFMS